LQCNVEGQAAQFMVRHGNLGAAQAGLPFWQNVGDFKLLPIPDRRHGHGMPIAWI
jgi:hypothetical protein